MADEGGYLGGALGALLLPTLVTGTTFFIAFPVIAATGLLAWPDRPRRWARSSI